MTHTILILAIVCGAMFVAIKVVDLIFNSLNIAPKREGIQPSQPEQITGRVIDSLQLLEYSPHHISVISSCEIEAGAICAICGEVANNAESLAEGIESISESAGEAISALLEGFSN